MEILNQKSHLDMNESQMLRQWILLSKYVARFDTIEGPRVGDYVLLDDGSMRRFCHDWDDSLQITPEGHSGSFNFDGGYMSYSGSLDPSIPKDKLRYTHTHKLGRVWFFKDGLMRAHSGIDALVPFKVWRYEPWSETI